MRKQIPSRLIYRIGIPIGLLLLLQGALCLHFSQFALIDDAFIAFRYVENLMNGHGLVYNIGERVEGYTCFLWILFLFVPAAIGFNLNTTSMLLGATCLLGTTVVTRSFCSEDDEPRPAWSLLIAPTLLVTNPGAALWAVHGLETALFTLLLTLAVRADCRDHASDSFTTGWSGVLYALATLTRPEGALIFAASAFYWTVTNPRRLALWSFWRYGIEYAGVVLPYWIWRFWYYGYPLPNTYYAKVEITLALVARGFNYVLAFFGGYGGLLFIALIPALVTAHRNRRFRFILWMAISYMVIVATEGGDVFPAFRFIIPVSPLLYVLVQEGIYRGSQWLMPSLTHRVLTVAAAVLVITGTVFHAGHLLEGARREAHGGDVFTKNMTLAGHALKRTLPPSARIALNPAGAVPYYSGLYSYDMLGLTNIHIAHRRIPSMGSGSPGHEKGDGKYILDQAPDIILFQNVRIEGGPVGLTKLPWYPVGRSETEIARDHRMQLGMYVPDQLPLGDGRYLVFLRRSDFRLQGH